MIQHDKGLLEALESLHNRAIKEMPDYEITEDYYVTLGALCRKNAERMQKGKSMTKPTDEVKQLTDEIDRLKERLEITHEYNADGKKVRAGEDIPDGITCRDETIRIQDEAIDTLRAENERLRGALRFYAEGEHILVYDTCPPHKLFSSIIEDRGEVAKQALGGVDND